MTDEATYTPLAALRAAITQAEQRGHRFTKQLWEENYSGIFGPGRVLHCDAWCFCGIVVRDDGSIAGRATEEDCLYGKAATGGQDTVHDLSGNG